MKNDYEIRKEATDRYNAYAIGHTYESTCVRCHMRKPESPFTYCTVCMERSLKTNDNKGELKWKQT